MKHIVNEITNYLLDHMSDPFPQYIIQKEIMNYPVDPLLTSRIKESQWYRQLEIEQRRDGSWGRFHSMDPDTKQRQKFNTTEEALRRASELSLTKEDPILVKSIGLMERYLRGIEAWPDRVEKHHDNGRSFCQSRDYITAANLCRFDQNNPLLAIPREICAKQLEAAFSTGTYNDTVWRKSNLDYSGTCLDAFMLYPLWLLQGTNYISDDLQRRYLHYICNKKEGIYYVSSFSLLQKVYLEDKRFTIWLNALEVLSGFTLIKELIEEQMTHLTAEIDRLMTKEVMLPTARAVTGHYSESWRSKNNRKNDLLLRMIRIIISITKE